MFMPDAASTSHAFTLGTVGFTAILVAYEVDRTTRPTYQQTLAARVSVARSEPYKKTRIWPGLASAVILSSISLLTEWPLDFGSAFSSAVLLIVSGMSVLLSSHAMNSSDETYAVKAAKMSLLFRFVGVAACVGDVLLSRPFGSLLTAALTIVVWLCMSLMNDLSVLRYWRESESWWAQLATYTQSRLRHRKAT